MTQQETGRVVCGGLAGTCFGFLLATGLILWSQYPMTASRIVWENPTVRGLIIQQYLLDIVRTERFIHAPSHLYRGRVDAHTFSESR